MYYVQYTGLDNGVIVSSKVLDSFYLKLHGSSGILAAILSSSANGKWILTWNI